MSLVEDRAADLLNSLAIPDAGPRRIGRLVAYDGQMLEATGLSLTDSFAMLPTAAVSGFYFGHAQAEYFGVARIGQDQVEDYAVRRGVEVAQAERWLRPNLD